VKDPPLEFVESIHERHDFRIFQPIIPQPLANMGPVLVLHVGIVIFLILPAPCELDRLLPVLGEIEMRVQEFSHVVRIESQERKRQAPYNVLDLIDDRLRAFPPDISLFGPTGGGIHVVDGRSIKTLCRSSAMRFGVGFQEARRFSSHWLNLTGICCLRNVPAWL
jgi:hypothetical protein